MNDLATILHRQAAFSRATFGPGERREGVIAHIRKELEELENAPDQEAIQEEWADVAILAFDGLLRALTADPDFQGETLDIVAKAAAWTYFRKLTKNELRTWPDWRTASPTAPIEHVRGEE